MSATDSTDISRKLDVLIRLQALTLVRGESTEQAKIGLLDSLGFTPTEIGKMLGKSPENIGVVLSRLRKKGKGSEGQSSKGDEGQTPLDVAKPQG